MRNLRTQFLILLRLLQEVDHLGKVGLRLIDAGDVVEGRPRPRVR